MLMYRFLSLPLSIGLFIIAITTLLLGSELIGVGVSIAKEKSAPIPNVAFTPGNVVVYRVGDGVASLNSNAAAVFLDEFTPSGSFVQSTAMPTAVNGLNKRLTASGSATSEGFLTRSENGQFLLVPGYDVAIGTGSITTSTSVSINRVIGRVDAAGNVDTTTALSDAISGGNPRGAASTNGTDLWIAGSSSGGGIRYATLGATTSTQISATPNNLRVPNIFGGQLYVSSSTGTFHLSTVGTGAPTTSGQTITNLPGFPSSGSRFGFFFADLNAGVAGVDTLYTADDSGQIQKYSLVAGNWNTNGAIALATVRGLTGTVSGSNVTLFVTAGSATTTLQKLTDTSGYNATITGTLSSLATAAPSTAFRGIAMAPGNVPTDTTPPTLTYTAFTNTGNTTNRVLTATVSDNVAVASGANLPRIYFRKNAGSYFSTQCSLTGGNAQSGTYDCTIDNSLIGGVTAGDTVGYFVIAQDTAGNVASNPSGAVAANVNSVTTPPTPNTYTILQTFSGSVSVGTGETITSLTNNGGLFQAMNAGTISGNTTINITSDLTAETGTHSLNQQVETGAGNWTILFQASGGPRLISGSNTTALINLNGADRVTFSCLAFGPNGLTFRNTGNGSTIRLINDASNNSILSCTIETGGIGIFFSSGALTGNNANSVTDSIIRARTVSPAVPVYSIRSDASPTNIRNSNIVVLNNTITDYTASGISLLDADNFTVAANSLTQSAPRSNVGGIESDRSGGSNLIERNTISDLTSSGTFDGIAVGEVGSTTISRNRIFGIDGQTTVLGAFVGVSFIGSAVNPSSVVVENNMITLAPSIPTDQAIVGLLDRSAAGNSLVARHNTFLIGGTSAGSQLSHGFLRISSAPSNITLTNNIFFNSRTGGGASHFAIGDAPPNQGSWASNYNLFVGTGSTSANFFEYGLTPVDFAAWKAGPPTRDANSLASLAGAGPFNVANMFVSPNDLHLSISGNNPAVNTGTNTALTTDFDGQTRPFNGMPDIGADEVQSVPTAADVSLSGRIADANGRGIRNIRVIISGGNLAGPRTALTGSFGYFSFDGLRVGETYVVTVSGKRYVILNPTRVITLNDELADVDFIGQPR